MSFRKYASTDPHGAPILRKSIITNSVVTTVMDSVSLASGLMALGTTGTTVFGHVVSIHTKEGLSPITSGATGAAIGSYTGTFTATSDNTTVAKVYALCDVSQSSMYSALLDATIGTTTGSDLGGYRLDLADEETLDESGASAVAAQYSIVEVDRNDSTRPVVNIFESQVFNT